MKNKNTYYNTDQFLKLKNVKKILGDNYKLTVSQERRLEPVLGKYSKYKICDCELSINIANMIKYDLTNYIGRMRRLDVLIKQHKKNTLLIDILKYGKEEGIKRHKQMCKKLSSTLPSNISYWIDKGLTKEEAINRVKEFNKSSAMCASQVLRGSSEHTVRSLTYWIKKGYTLSDAKKEVQKIQGTNNLNYYIKKYGNEEGKIRFKCRQEKWLKTLNDFTPEEKELLKLKKGHSIESYIANGYSEEEAKKLSYNYYKKRKNYSLISQKCFDMIAERLNGTYFYKLKNYEKQINGKNVDFYDLNRKIVIEFNGNFWHGDKRFYKDDFLIYNKTAKQVREEDNARLQKILQSEKVNKIIIIWEDIFRKNPTNCVNETIKLMEKSNGTNGISKRIEEIV